MGVRAAVIAPLLPTYARADFAFERGAGARLFTTTGEEYLDFGAGIAVASLGHAHPHLVEALTRQAENLWHTSNLYRIPEGELAKRLTEATFADTVFFTNSGAEALECAIKMARKFHASEGHPERFRLITFEVPSTAAPSPPSPLADNRNISTAWGRRSRASTR